MTPDRLTEMGKALYGDTWQAHVSRALEVNDRTIRRWLVGAVPDWVEPAMQRLLDRRKMVIERLQEAGE